MITQDIIEVREGESYEFEAFIESSNLPTIPSVATMEIFSSDGDTILSSTSMVIDGTTGVASYTWNSTGTAKGVNYIAKFLLDTTAIVRLFDIYLTPFINLITDDDLILEYSEIKSGVWEQSGTAQSGTTSTIVDNSRFEDTGTWNGGKLEIIQDNELIIRDVVSYVSSTSTITFTPVIDPAITTEKYLIRKSYQNDIDYAGNKVVLDLKKIDRRASLILDNNATKYLVVYKFFESYFFKLIKQEGDEFYLKYNYYKEKYSSELQGLNLVYDSNDDGVIDDDETNTKLGEVTWYR